MYRYRFISRIEIREDRKKPFVQMHLGSDQPIRRVRVLMAMITVLMLIRAAPIAGVSTIP
jgi:hypothetical protein